MNDENIVKIAALSHSKLRNAIGLVGIEAEPIRQEITVRMAKHWDRKQLNDIAPDIAQLWNRIQWSQTIIDQMVGEHVIQGLRRTESIPIRIIYIKKKVLDPGEIRRVKTMDMTEMTQYMLQLKLAHRIKFRDKPSQTMQELETQVSLFSEHTTEAGDVKYYAPGDELDNLTKALIMACFAARPFLQDSVEIVGGPIPRTNVLPTPDIAEMMQRATGTAGRDITNRGFRRSF